MKYHINIEIENISEKVNSFEREKMFHYFLDYYKNFFNNHKYFHIEYDSTSSRNSTATIVTKYGNLYLYNNGIEGNMNAGKNSVIAFMKDIDYMLKCMVREYQRYADYYLEYNLTGINPRYYYAPFTKQNGNNYSYYGNVVEYTVVHNAREKKCTESESIKRLRKELGRLLLPPNF